MRLDGPAGTQAVDDAIEASAAWWRSGDPANAHGPFPQAAATDALVASTREVCAELLGGAAGGHRLRRVDDLADHAVRGGRGPHPRPGRRGGRDPARPRRQRPAVGGGGRAGGRHRAVRRARPGHAGPRARSTSAAVLSDRTRWVAVHRHVERHRHGPRRRRHLPPRPRRRRPHLRRRRRRHAPPADRPPGLGRRRRRLLRVQVVRPPRRGAERRPGPAGRAAPGQARPVPRHRARAVGARHPPVRAARRRAGRGPVPARPGRSRSAGPTSRPWATSSTPGCGRSTA